MRETLLRPDMQVGGPALGLAAGVAFFF